MSTADTAAEPLSRARKSAAALARAPRIPARRPRDAASTAQKRAAIVLRRGMKQAEFRHLESQMDAHDLGSLPVLVAQKRGSVADTPVCGLIVTGGDMQPTHAERDMIQDAVRLSLERKLPILALSDAADLVLEAAELEADAGDAVLINGEVRVLRSQREIDDAVKMIARAPLR